jgi:hypothetical protein
MNLRKFFEKQTECVGILMRALANSHEYDAVQMLSRGYSVLEKDDCVL